MRFARLVLLAIATLGLGVAVPTSFRMATQGMVSEPALRADPEVLFADDFEAGIGAWTFQDLTVQDTFWHIDTLNPWSGTHCFWCGTYSEPGWTNPDYGYADEWGQFLISPSIDLSGGAGDTLLLKFYQRPSQEVPSGGYPAPQWDGWDCITVWLSTDDGVTWFPIEPDTVRYPGHGYNIRAGWCWYWNIMAGEYDSIPGWGWGRNELWSEIGFDLSAYKDSTVRVRFSGVSDPAESDASMSAPPYYYGMWYLDDLEISDDLGTMFFFEDCESGMGSWAAIPRAPVGNAWHLSEYRANSGTRSVYSGDSLTHALPGGGSYCAVVSPEIDLSSVSTSEPCVVDFWAYFDYADPYNDNGQYYMIEVTSDGGVTWTNIYAPYAGEYIFSGSSGGAWQSHNNYWGMPMLLDHWVGYVVQIRITSCNRRVPEAGEGMYLDDFSVTGSYVAFPRQEQVLVYDDDLGAFDVWGYGWEKYYEASVANLGYSELTINEIDQGIPDSVYLRRNGMVIWHLGPRGRRFIVGDPIDPLALTNLGGYLRMGGKLLIVGEDYLYDNFPNPFADTVLEISAYTEEIGCDTIYGESGDPIGDGLVCPIDFSPLDGNTYGWDFSDDFTTTATPVFTTNRSGLPVMLRKEDGYRLVFSTVPLEAIPYAALRDSLLQRIIAWLDPTPPAPVLVQAASRPAGVQLYWQANPPNDLGGYQVYRSAGATGPFDLLGSTAADETTWVDSTAVLDSTYFYGITATDLSLQESGMSEILEVLYYVGVEAYDPDTPSRLQLILTPNPFRGRTLLHLNVSGRGTRSLTVYDVSGRLVRDLSGFVPTGAGLTSFKVSWDGTDQAGRQVPAGVYFVRLATEDTAAVEKAVLLR